MADDEVGFLVFLKLLGVPGDGIDQGTRGEISWHFCILSFHDFEVVSLHGFLELVEGLVVHW